MKLSDTALIVLNAAAQRNDRLVPRRAKAPPVVDVNVCRALVKQGLIEMVLMPPGATDLVTVREDDTPMAFLVADAGFRAINLDPPGSGETLVTEASTTPHVATDAEVAQEAAAVADALDTAAQPPTNGATARTNLRQAAAAVLAVWDDEANRAADIIGALEAPMATLRTLLADRAPRNDPNGAPRKPREGTKQEAVLTMLRRTEGATVAQVTEVTGWASHTVRGFFAGLKKKGINVEVLERVRQVGPNKEGAKGSFSIYHVATAV